MDDFRFTVTEHDQYLETTVRGAPTMTDFGTMMWAMTEGSRFRSLCRLWDLRECELNLSTIDLQTLAEQALSFSDETSKVALLVDSEVNFGISRIHRAYRVSDAHQLNVFRDLDEAIAWLIAA